MNTISPRAEAVASKNQHAGAFPPVTGSAKSRYELAALCLERRDMALASPHACGRFVALMEEVASVLFEDAGQIAKLRAKLSETRHHLRAANKGAERNALVAQLCAARAAIRTQQNT